LFSPPWSGLLSTAGSLVFGSTTEGQVFALHAKTGQPLWRYQTGGMGRSNPMSYSVDSKQFVGVTMGNALYVFGLE
jgi:alcohol dehydrogenase (cytochrome c)